MDDSKCKATNPITSKPTTTTLKATNTSTSTPTTATQEAPVTVGLAVGVAALFIVILVLLICWKQDAKRHSHSTNPITSKPTTTTLKGPPSQLPAGVCMRVAVLLGFSILTLVILLRLIGWWRTRGVTGFLYRVQGLNSASDAPPVGERLGPGAADQYFPSPSHRMYQHDTVDMDVDRAPRGPLVGSAQDRVDPGELSDAAAYENLGVPPRCVGDPPWTRASILSLSTNCQDDKRVEKTRRRL
ncbi:hypothetical protein CRUP_031172, partial [Coryphaenoides rupestris]